MKKKAELMQKINEFRKNVLDLLQEGKLDDAKVKAEELDKLVKEYDSMPSEVKEVNNKMDRKQKLVKAINGYLHRGWAGMADEDRAVLTPVDATGSPAQVETVTDPSRGSVFVPFQQADYTEFMQTGLYRLRSRVSSYAAKTLSGRIPLANNPTSGLIEQYDEYPTAGIAKKDIKFGSVDWSVRPYGAIVPISNMLIRDSSQDIMAVIAEIFFRAQVVTEDQLILGALDSAGEAVEATSWKDVVKALNSCAPIMGEKVLITNVSGWNELDTATDDNGLPILVPFLSDSTRMRIKGYEVIELPDEILPNDAVTGAIPMYACSPKDAVVYIEREGLEFFANPYGAGFERDAVEVKVTSRMDCKLKYADAVKKLAYVPAEETNGEG